MYFSVGREAASSPHKMGYAKTGVRNILPGRADECGWFRVALEDRRATERARRLSRYSFLIKKIPGMRKRKKKRDFDLAASDKDRAKDRPVERNIACYPGTQR